MKYYLSSKEGTSLNLVLSGWKFWSAKTLSFWRECYMSQPILSSYSTINCSKSSCGHCLKTRMNTALPPNNSVVSFAFLPFLDILYLLYWHEFSRANFSFFEDIPDYNHSRIWNNPLEPWNSPLVYDECKIFLVNTRDILPFSKR